ncbi:MAG: AAA-like domain-containing protein [Cyanobacteria bacterium J06555_13]
MEFPSGALSLRSPFYVERPPIEALCYQNIEVPGSLTRLKGPRQMGKSSLLVRLLAQAQNVGYETVLIDFQTAEDAIYSDLSRFLRWFCSAVARQLKLPANLLEYWDEDTGAKLSATIYFEDYLLAMVNAPIVLALNEVNRVFEHPEVARDFLPLLRFWHEQAKHDAAFSRLRTIVVHSTDVYVPLNIHQSPFNVGLPVQLKPFSAEQASQLASRYGIVICDSAEMQSLLALVGGHPYLLSVAFYQLRQQNLSIPQLIASASSLSGPFSHHLQACSDTLQQQPALVDVIKQVMASSEPVALEATQAHQLVSLGLIALEGDHCRMACELYRSFFTRYGLSSSAQASSSQQRQFQQLKTENAQLKVLANLDGLTQLSNRRVFDLQLGQAWQRSKESGLALSLIILDIDCFKRYNDTYGHLTGDFCLKQVANVLRSRVRKASGTAARYGGEEFAVILPETDGLAAAQIAAQLRDGIRALNITHVTSLLPSQVVTASIGVASVKPNSYSNFESPSCLIEAADAALYVSKQQGRDRFTVSTSIAQADSQAVRPPPCLATVSNHNVKY